MNELCEYQNARCNDKIVLHEIILKIRYGILFLKLNGTDRNEGSIHIQKLCFRRQHFTLAWLPCIQSRVMNRPMGVLFQVRGCSVSGALHKTRKERDKTVLGRHGHKLAFLPDQTTGPHVATKTTRYRSIHIAF